MTPEEVAQRYAQAFALGIHDLFSAETMPAIQLAQVSLAMHSALTEAAQATGTLPQAAAAMRSLADTARVANNAEIRARQEQMERWKQEDEALLSKRSAPPIPR